MENDFKIYTVQVLYVEEGKIKRHHNWGYYLTFEQAEEVIFNNITDIYEHNYYNFVLLNEVPPGILMTHAIKENWYEVIYNSTNNDPLVKHCDKPINKQYRIGLDW